MLMKFHLSPFFLLVPLAALCATPKLPGVGAAMQAAVDAGQISGAVTVVVSKDKILHLEATGLADRALVEQSREFLRAARFA